MRSLFVGGRGLRVVRSRVPALAVALGLTLGALGVLVWAGWEVSQGRPTPQWAEAIGTLASTAAVALLTIVLVLMEARRDRAEFEILDAVIWIPSENHRSLTFDLVNGGGHDSSVKRVTCEDAVGEIPVRESPDPRAPAMTQRVASGKRSRFNFALGREPSGEVTLRVEPVLGRAVEATVRIDRRPAGAQIEFGDIRGV